MSKIVSTPCGQVQGTTCRLNNVIAFKGIRYATAGRWEYPTLVTHWDGIYDASEYGACSYQPRSFYNEEENLKKIFYYNEFRKGETYTYSEDCQFLNIFTPDTVKEGDTLPVLIYIHGGGVNKILSSAPAEKNYNFWKKAMAYAGCETLEQFRAISPEKLFEAWDQTKKELRNPGCFPCIDGHLVVGSGSELLAAGKQHKIPYMAGVTSEDMMPPILHSMAKKWNAAQNTTCYTWHFDRQLPGDENGAWHSSDLWYWFGTLPNCWRPMEKKDYDLSNQMTDYLCNFAKTGNPNKKTLPTWEPASSAKSKVMCFGEQPTGMRKPSGVKMVVTMLTNKAVGE